MIEYTTGDIFDADVEAMVCPVNCMGVMGAGLAAEFKKRFPDYFFDYNRRCRRGDIDPGSVWVHATGNVGKHAYIISAATKSHWRDESRIEWVISALRQLPMHMRREGIASAAVPALGCGLGGLSWADVKPLFDQHLGSSACRFVVYEPLDASGARS